MAKNVQQAMDIVIDRTRNARSRPARLLAEPSTYDAQRIAEIIARWEQASPGPWIIDGHFKGDNWLIASCGSDENGQSWCVTTDGIHVSEKVTGGAQEDAEFIAHSWADVLYLLRLVQQMQLRVLRGEVQP